MTRKIKLGSQKIRLPRTAAGRIVLGTALVLGGLLWFLPILGFWMLPLGVWVLSQDVPLIRNWRRRFLCWFRRRKQAQGDHGKSACAEQRRCWPWASPRLQLTQEVAREEGSAAAEAPPNISEK